MTVWIECKRCRERIVDKADLILEHGVLKHNDDNAKYIMSKLHELRRLANDAGKDVALQLEKELQLDVDNHFLEGMFKKRNER